MRRVPKRTGVGGMRRDRVPEARRSVSRKKKIVLLVLLVLAAAAVLWYKLPRTITADAVMTRVETGDSDAYGERVQASLTVRVQRYLFSPARYTGAITVNGETMDNRAFDALRPRVFSLTAAAADVSSFLFTAGEWRGRGETRYLLTRCEAVVRRGRLVSLTLHDAAGVFAGRYQ